MFYEPSPTQSNTTQNHPVQTSLNQLNEDVNNLIKENKAHLEEISRITKEFNVYKRAYSDLETKHDTLEIARGVLEKKNEDLEAQMKGSRVVVLIDGDGSIFLDEFLSKGQIGGMRAARQISDHLIQYLMQNFGSHQYKLWVYIFLNKRGLFQSLMNQGQQQTAKKLDPFIVGFNQAAERFTMIDVGWAKEAADVKIKTYLEDEIRMYQTFKIFFAGCHDNGYVNNLRSQITAGYKEKLILLKTYDEMAVGISELGLPTMTIPNVFMTEKLKPHFIPDHGHTRSNSIPAIPMMHRDSDTLSVTSDQALSDIGLYSPNRTLLDLPNASGYDHMLTPPSPLISNKLNLEPTKRQRQLDPKIPLWRNQPPPCNLFYIARNCKHGAQCKFGHDYELTGKNLVEMRKNAKKAPCPLANKGEACIDDNCFYGHVCPGLSKCFYLKQGKCKFIGPNMHTEPPMF